MTDAKPTEAPLDDGTAERVARAWYEHEMAERFKNPPAWDSPLIRVSRQKMIARAKVALAAARPATVDNSGVIEQAAAVIRSCGSGTHDSRHAVRVNPARAARLLAEAGLLADVTAASRIRPTSDPGYDAGNYVDELARMQSRINAALELIDEMRGYVPEYFAEKWGFDKQRAALTDPTAEERT